MFTVNAPGDHNGIAAILHILADQIEVKAYGISLAAFTTEQLATLNLIYHAPLVIITVQSYRRRWFT